MQRHTSRWLTQYVVGLALLLAACWVVGLLGQQLMLYVGDTSPEDIRWAEKGDFDGRIIFCRGFYGSDREEAGGSGWWTDYPGADNNFLVRVSELTKIRVRLEKDHRQPFYRVIELHDPLIFKCPVLFMEDAGTMRLDDRAIANLRKYMKQGGFIWVDDFWGSAAWDQWEQEIRQVLPSASYPMIDIPADHPMLHMLYDVKGIWQQSRIGVWNGTECADEGGACGYGTTSERGIDSAVPHLRGILDEHGRVIVVSTHNTDIADGWEEDKPENFLYLQEFSARSYALGINIFLYALTH